MNIRPFDIASYIIYLMLLMVFFYFEGTKMIFSLAKIFLSDEKIIPFERHNAPRRSKIGTNDVKLQSK